MSAQPAPYFRIAASDLIADDDDEDDDDLFEDEETLVYVQIDDDEEIGPDVSWSMVDEDELYGLESEPTLRSVEIDVSELRGTPRPPPLPLPGLSVPARERERMARPLPSPPRPPAPPLKKRPLPFKARPVSPWSLEAYRGRVIAVKARRRKDTPAAPVPPPWLLNPPPVDVPSASTGAVTLPASPDETDDRKAARIVSTESRGSGSFMFALLCATIGALLYVGAQKSEAAKAHAAVPAPVAVAAPAVAMPETVTTAPSASPPRAPAASAAASASMAPRASASAAKHVAPPPKHVSAPPPPPVPAVKRAPTGDSVEKALSDARRETDSTL